MPITCPICDSAYVIASAPLVAGAVPEQVAPNKEFADNDALAPADAPEIAAEDIPDVEGTDEPVAAEEDETFLEEEEEAGDVSGIIGVGGEDEEEV